MCGGELDKDQWQHVWRWATGVLEAACMKEGWMRTGGGLDEGWTRIEGSMSGVGLEEAPVCHSMTTCHLSV